uniref:Uncharacterized protein n=1 Tax=Anopheles melas TaxID=34690 RepID=A0A182UH62_9DIPT
MPTFARFPVRSEAQPVRAEAEDAPERRKAPMGAATILPRTFTIVLAAVPVRCQARPRQTFATAAVAAPPVRARILARTVAISQEALVDVWPPRNVSRWQNQQRRMKINFSPNQTGGKLDVNP